jgi:hypothetical protein
MGDLASPKRFLKTPLSPPSPSFLSLFLVLNLLIPVTAACTQTRLQLKKLVSQAINLDAPNSSLAFIPSYVLPIAHFPVTFLTPSDTYIMTYSKYLSKMPPITGQVSSQSLIDIQLRVYIIKGQSADHGERAGEGKIARLQELYEEIEGFLVENYSVHRDGSDDDLVPALESAIEVLASRIQSYSRQPRGPPGPLSSFLYLQPSDARREQPQIMQDAGLALSWHNKLDLSEAQDLSDDLDSTHEIDINSLAESENWGPSTPSGTLVGAYTRAMETCRHQKGQSAPLSYDGVLIHPALGKETTTAISTDLIGITHTLIMDREVPQHGHSSKVATRSPTLPQAEQQGGSDTCQFNRTSKGGRLLGSLRSLRNYQPCYHRSMVICYFIVIVVIAAQMFLACELTRIKVSQRPAKSASTADNEIFTSLLEFLLGVLHNIAPLALLIATVVRDRERDHTTYKGYLRWFASMLITYFGIMTVSIVMQVRGKREYSMLFIGISDSWFVATMYFFFENVWRPSDSLDKDDGGDDA